MTGRVQNHPLLDKLPIGISGFDLIAQGGIPLGRTTLLAGAAGSGKTLFALQFLVQGVRQYDQGGVIVTFDENPKDLARNVRSLGWSLDELVSGQRIAIVDASPDPGDEVIETGPFDLSALLARIEHAIRSVNATRVILDSIGAVFLDFRDAHYVRRELHRVAAGLRLLNVTSLLTLQRAEIMDEAAHSGMALEASVADNLVLLRNRLEQGRRRRTVEILKFRGAAHHKGEYPFTIDDAHGVTVLPLAALELSPKAADVRVSSGNAALDKLCGGGPFPESITLVSGATGTGKTLLVTEFVQAALQDKQRALLFAFEESREQLFRNALACGVDLLNAENDGVLRLVCRYPETLGLADHLVQIKRDIEEFRPSRIAIDGMSALERVASPDAFREFIISLIGQVRSHECTCLLTHTTPELFGADAWVSDTPVARFCDAIILLRYVASQHELRRELTVLKMRGSWHDTALREYRIDQAGIHIDLGVTSEDELLGLR
jgi:circadian clock protein KaiC